MPYYVSFHTHDRDGKRSTSWFLFNEAGETLKSGFQTKDAALAWAFREFGFLP